MQSFHCRQRHLWQHRRECVEASGIRGHPRRPHLDHALGDPCLERVADQLLTGICPPTPASMRLLRTHTLEPARRQPPQRVERRCRRSIPKFGRLGAVSAPYLRYDSNTPYKLLLPQLFVRGRMDRINRHDPRPLRRRRRDRIRSTLTRNAFSREIRAVANHSGTWSKTNGSPTGDRCADPELSVVGRDVADARLK